MMQLFHDWVVTNNITLSFSDYISIITLVVGVVGGVIALKQWRDSILEKRSIVLKDLIEKVRTDEQIATVMDMIDWNEDFKYDGKFRIKSNTSRKILHELDDTNFFKMIDKTLSYFSFICYLKKKRIIRDDDVVFFDYELRRLFDNEHISNYLYSLYHWSKQLGIEMSFSYLIDFGLEKGYLTKDFLRLDVSKYICYLTVNHKD